MTQVRIDHIDAAILLMYLRARNSNGTIPSPTLRELQEGVRKVARRSHVTMNNRINKLCKMGALSRGEDRAARTVYITDEGMGILDAVPDSVILQINLKLS